MSFKCDSDLPDQAEFLASSARRVLEKVSARGLSIATGESCTGGLIASLLTDIEGLSSTFDRGFIVYSNASKVEMLGIDPDLLLGCGPVSREVALAMAMGVLDHADADIALSVTGFAGPAGEGDEPGLVYIAGIRRRGSTIVREYHFGDAAREVVRFHAADAALTILSSLVADRTGVAVK